MNSYDLSRAWWDYCFDNPTKIAPRHSALYFFCIELNNRLGWKVEFGLPTDSSMEAIGIRSYKTYKETFDELIDFGFVKLIKPSKNQYTANIIALVKKTKAKTKANTKALDKAISMHESKQVKSIASIDKQGNNETIKPRNKKPTPPIEKTQYLDSVFLKEDEYSKLIEKHGEADVKLMLEKLNWWKLDKQTEAQQKSGSDYAKINGWVSKWLSDEKAKIGRVNEKLNAAPAPKPSNAVEVVGDYSRTSF